MSEDALLNSKFSSEKELVSFLPQLGNEGFKLIGFGRYQPFHLGHKSMFETAMELTNINVKDLHVILNNKARLVNGEKNPFSARQRKEMFQLAFPELPPENVQAVRVYLGGGGDVGRDIDILRNAIGKCGDRDKTVLVYFEKEEDRHPYLVNDLVINDTHYAHLVAHREGPHVLKITQNMIDHVSKYVPIDAKMFRAGLKSGQDEVAYELLPQNVAEYVKEQYRTANMKGIEVGDVFDDRPLPMYRQASRNLTHIAANPVLKRIPAHHPQRPTVLSSDFKGPGLGLGAKE